MVRLSASRLNMEDGRIDRAIFKDSGEFVVGGVRGIDVGGTTFTLDCSLGNVWHIILAQSTTLSITNPAPSGASMTLTLYIKQGGTGSKTITWPSAVIWTSGIAPVLATGIGRTDVVRLQTSNGGSTWYGSFVAQNFSVRGSNTWLWGQGTTGEIGFNDILSRSSPVQIGTLVDWSQTSLGAGSHTVATKTDGTLWSWGAGTSGKLGSNAIANRSSPVQVGILTNWAVTASGSSHSVALKTDGTLWTWGSAVLGSLGLNNTANRSSPTQVGTLTNWATVSAGRDITAAIKTDGTLWTWGYGSSGKLGQNNTTYRSSPAQVGTLGDWASICAISNAMAAIKRDGTLLGMGNRIWPFWSKCSVWEPVFFTRTGRYTD